MRNENKNLNGDKIKDIRNKENNSISEDISVIYDRRKSENKSILNNGRNSDYERTINDGVISDDNDILVEIDDVSKHFKVAGGVLKAVNHVNLTIKKGETLGLVGESGCGKSTLSKIIMGIYPPTEGRINYHGKKELVVSKKNLFEYAKMAQIIFQDPYSSLNPRMTVGSIIEEGMIIHKMYDRKKRQERIYELLELVGLNAEHAGRYPHEFSGGQRQRIGIARALAIEPEFIICDEPISALDVSIQAQIINLLYDLQKKLNLTYLFIAHDLNIVKYISDRIAVMYLGHIVELASADELYKNPLHPYSKALLSAVPVPDPKKEARKKGKILEGDVPSPINPKPGCPFAGRCPYATDICRTDFPEPEFKKGHLVACHHAKKIYNMNKH